MKSKNPLQAKKEKKYEAIHEQHAPGAQMHRKALNQRVNQKNPIHAPKHGNQ